MAASLELDVAAGSVTLPDGAIFAPGTSMESAARVLASNGVQAENSHGVWLVVRNVVVWERPCDVRLSFGREVNEVELMAAGSADGLVPLSEELAAQAAHLAWLVPRLGRPAYERSRGAVYRRPWGWIYVLGKTLFLTWPGYRPAVALPGEAGLPAEDFRCLRCGAVEPLAYGVGVLEVSRNRGGVPCEACGAVRWVLRGSMTEFYRWSRRPNVCEAGGHVAEEVETYELVPVTERAAAPGPVRFLVKSCRKHLGLLEQMFGGAARQVDRGDAS